jgi:hypothetical protein
VHLDHLPNTVHCRPLRSNSSWWRPSSVITLRDHPSFDWDKAFDDVSAVRCHDNVGPLGNKGISRRAPINSDIPPKRMPPVTMHHQYGHIHIHQISISHLLRTVHVFEILAVSVLATRYGREHQP